MLNVKNLVKIW